MVDFKTALRPWLLAVAASLLAPTTEAQSRPIASASSDTLSLRLVRRIGSLDGAPEYAFGTIVNLVPLADGGFYTCDGDDLVVRRYRTDGTFVRQVGRRGAGPAEYNHCFDIDLMGDSALVVSDPRNARFVFFRADDSYDRVVLAHVFPGLGGGTDAFFIDDRGRIWKRGARANALPEPGEGEFGQTQFVILDATGARVDSVLVPRGSGSRIGRGFALSTSEGMYYHSAPDTIWTPMRDGSFIVAPTDAYRVEVRKGGATVRTITRASVPVAYTPAEHAIWEAWRAYFASRQPQYPPVAIPRVKPVLRELRVDADGIIWVKVHVTAELRPIPPRPAGDARPLLTWRERNTFDLFDSRTGAFRGRVALPYATKLLGSRGNRLWTLEEGASGEHLIGIYEIALGSRAR